MHDVRYLFNVSANSDIQLELMKAVLSSWIKANIARAANKQHALVYKVGRMRYLSCLTSLLRRLLTS